MARGSPASSQRNVSGGRGRPRFPRSSRGGPRGPFQDRHYSPPTDEEGSDNDSAEAERRQPASTDEEGSEQESAQAERRQPTPIDDQGSDHDSAEAEGDNDNGSREGSQTRPTSQATPVDEERSNHAPPAAEGGSDNESRERSQTRPNSNDQRFARAAHVFETRVRSAWNRFELGSFQRDGTPPTPILEQGSTAIYHSPSILQFYFTNTPPAINTKSNTDHGSDNRAPSSSNTQAPPGEDAQNPRKRKRSEEDDDDEEDQERYGPVDTLLAAIEAGMLSRDDREIMMAALENADLQGDEEVEGGGEGESNEDEMQSDERFDEVGEGDRDAQQDEGVLEGDDVSGEGGRAVNDVEMPGDEEVLEDSEGALSNAERHGDEGVSGDVEGQALTQEAPDGDTIVVAGASNHQSGIQEDTEDITRGRSMSRTGGSRQRGTGSSGSEEDLYGSSVSPSGRRRPVTHEDRDDQPVADDGANHSEEEEEDELPTDNMHETPLRPRGRPTSGRTSHGSWSYEPGAEMTTVSATVEASNILPDAADGRRSLRQFRQNSVAATGHAEGAGHAVSAQRHVEERRASTRRSSHRASRVESIVPRESPLKQSSVPRQEERGPSPQASQADTGTPSRSTRGIRGSPEKQRAKLPAIPEERPMGKPHIPTPHNPETTSKRKRPTGSDRMPARPRSLSPPSQDQDMAAMGIGRMSTRSSPEEEEEEEGSEDVPETTPEERSSGDESEKDDHKGPEENIAQRHPEQIGRHPHEPESKKRKTDAPRKPVTLHPKATGNPRVADQKKATEEDEVASADQKKATEEEETPPAGSERDTSPLPDVALEEEEEQPPVKPPAKRQKTRRHGRG
ncbi:hypothetical protein KC343_g3738 [Hortaea werneckii]|nr:hypothetical protein KC352_g12774 [Hortaea werneckii]KAI7569500.1 hypothetical protein KC317_g3281 [Hortaea werneckii]KAI7621343.1 hypothetical protein KC346_g3681 [Hortaea werneckii]KAI7631943.1 hypothetical protein KC343_g3738 [Hortaea werneckii]KAI7678104.1 hypothetical protein KC319_g3541 [Hortaea werneckii]